jgi:nitrile hydratase accessory protein
VSEAHDLASLDAALTGAAPLPRSNGELVFEEPWQARALGLGVAVMDQLGVPWTEWREHLAPAIAAHGHDPSETAATAYYTAWLDALESLLRARAAA